MVYIQLTNPLQGFDKLRIKEFMFFDTNGELNKEKALGFKYQIYKKEDKKYIPKEDVHLSVKGQDKLESILETEYKHLNPYDSICRNLLNYIVELDIANGTIEKE